MGVLFNLSGDGSDELRKIAAQLRGMNQPRVGLIFRRNLRTPANMMQDAIRSRIAAIPTHDGHSGLRARLIRCVRVSVRTTGPDTLSAVYMNVFLMPSGQYALPLTMEGVKVWLHPVFNPLTIAQGAEPVVTQPPHPYFYPVVASLGPTAAAAVEKAVEEIRLELSG